eukprot:2913438-Alexandrium_andersonii.AAC.1
MADHPVAGCHEDPALLEAQCVHERPERPVQTDVELDALEASQADSRVEAGAGSADVAAAPADAPASSADSSSDSSST